MEPTRKYPRTLEQAFGPYQRHGLVDRDDRSNPDTIVVIACLLGAAALVAITVLGWLPGAGR